MAVPAAVDLVARPERGRCFTTTRRVRLVDVDTTGRLCLDGLARYFQDVANDDSRDAGFDPLAPWLVRRTLISLDTAPRLGEVVTLITFSGGHGSRWAERRTSLTGTDGGRVEAASLWIFVDPATGRPARLTEAFHATYDEAAAGRMVTARLQHGPHPEDVDRRPWPLRTTDLDVLGHVNNAATWAAVEDELARRALVPVRAELEYPGAIGPKEVVELCSTVDAAGTVCAWLVVEEAVRASAMVATRPV